MNTEQQERTVNTPTLEQRRNLKTPLYGCISCEGERYTLLYKPDSNGNSSSLQGYDPSVFDGCPWDMPVIDFRTSNAADYFASVFPAAAPEYGGDLWAYILAAKRSGATILDCAEVVQ
jgi:hypothetical protein